ncbi:MAG: membrane protein insertion efficiency factor YidD [Nitrospinaceae bacterium]
MLNRFFIFTLKMYQKGISPFLAPSCRFYPSCSEYAVQALDRFSLFRAVGRIFMRLLKCHPYHEGGADPLK